MKTVITVVTFVSAILFSTHAISERMTPEMSKLVILEGEHVGTVKEERVRTILGKRIRGSIVSTFRFQGQFYWCNVYLEDDSKTEKLNRWDAETDPLEGSSNYVAAECYDTVDACEEDEEDPYCKRNQQLDVYGKPHEKNEFGVYD